jgi:LemA protein
MWWIVIVVLAVLIALGLALVAVYNELVTLQNRYKNAYAQIDVQLKRRHDLIPNLVEATRAYLTHERATLEAVIAARNVASGARSRAAASPGEPRAMGELASAEAALSGTLGRLLAVSEAYPALRANETIRDLTEVLRSTEDRVSFARQAYNDAVTSYDIGRQKMPHVVVARYMDLPDARLWHIEDAGDRDVPRVSLGAA